MVWLSDHQELFIALTINELGSEVAAEVESE